MVTVQKITANGRKDISIHTLRVEGDKALLIRAHGLRISIHTLRVEGDNFNICCFSIKAHISIHTLRVEGDPMTPPIQQPIPQFQSTPSVWRVTFRRAYLIRLIWISIHTLRVEGDSVNSVFYNRHFISIHTLRVEGDWCLLIVILIVIYISIHTLRVEGDKSLHSPQKSRAKFQSTPSVWRVTVCFVAIFSVMKFQSTPSVWRVTSYCFLQIGR